MLAALHLALLGTLAYQIRNRLALLSGFKGIPQYLFAFGLMLFLCTWYNFVLYVVLGWGVIYDILSTAGLLIPIAFGWFRLRSEGLCLPSTSFPASVKSLLDLRHWNMWLLFFGAFVISRFYSGLVVDPIGNVWCNFNFVDTAFHLSIANAFLSSPGFPPVDLDMAPYPLKYHFLADFYLAHTIRNGISALQAVWLMNLVSSIVLVGTLWGAFERWLQLHPRWIMVACFVFLFLNPALLNLLHHLTLNPSFFNPSDFFVGVLRFPYFNFEFVLTNLFEPQRALLFTFPIALLILEGAFGTTESTPTLPADRTKALQSFALVCLLPLSHIVAFAVLSLSLVPKVWRHRRALFGSYRLLLPVFVLGILQLGYLLFFGPANASNFSGWDVHESIPLDDFRTFPVGTRRVLFWFFINGDFFFWSILFASVAFIHRLGLAGDSPRRRGGLVDFLWRWRWYFIVCLVLFLVINVYRYSLFWGDSNKFVLFLNLGLSMVITVGAARINPRRYPMLSAGLWWFFLLLCAAPPAYAYYRTVLASPHPNILLFTTNDLIAAEWLKSNLSRADIVLTAAYNDSHFVSALGGSPTLAGIYGDSNPYRHDNRAEQIRQVYAEGDFDVLTSLGADYVCISRFERLKYKIHPKWIENMKSGAGLRFRVGGSAEDYESVYIFETAKLHPKGGVTDPVAE